MLTIEKSAHNLQAMQPKDDTDKMTQANNWMTHNIGRGFIAAIEFPELLY